jgi:hypothetical protein
MAFSKFRVKKGVRVFDPSSSSYVDFVPVGLIIPYANSTPPPGWLMCDGSSTSGYSELAAIVGATTPNLSADVVVGAGTGTGGGSSGNGSISGGSTLTARTVGNAIGTDTHSAVSFSHLHSMESHTHSLTHAHSYPHTHTNLHIHSTQHFHTMQSDDGGHQHTGFFGSTNQGGPGSAARNTNVVTGSLLVHGPAGGHGHPMPTNTGVTLQASAMGVGPGFTSTFAASATASTVTNNDGTGVFPSSGTSFSVQQPSMTVYYIIKY